MWIILDLQTQYVLRNPDWQSYTFSSRVDAANWHKANPTCDQPFYVELPDNGAPTSTDLAANRAAVASKLKQLAEKNGGYEVLQSALEFLRV